jgi:hypothetical protein
LSGKLTADFVSEVVVQNVFEINVIEIVSPRVENLEALVLDTLCSETTNVFLDEGSLAFVNTGGVGDVVVVHSFLGVADKLTDSLDAR